MDSRSNTPVLVRFTNCTLAFDGESITRDLYICGTSGKILEEPSAEQVTTTIDLGGRVLSPGLIDVQLNGAIGVNFSDVPATDEGMEGYITGLRNTFVGLIKTGVTSFLPTLVTAKSDDFKRVRCWTFHQGNRLIPTGTSACSTQRAFTRCILGR